MTLLFLLRSLHFGGAERQLVVLAKGLHQRGHRVTVVTFYDGGPLEQELRQAGVPVRCLKKRGRWDVIGFARRLIRTVRDVRPDILHSYLTDPNLVAALLKIRFPHLRIVWGVRDSAVDPRAYDWLFRVGLKVTSLLSRVPDKIIVNSHTGHLDYVDLGYCDRSMVVIPNGIDTARFVPNSAARRRTRLEWGVQDDEPVIGIVGRVAPMKDHATFLHAAALLRRERPTVRFVIIGDGPTDHRTAMHRLGQSLGLDERVLWRSAQHDLVGPYNALDVLVNSSCEGEGFGNVIAEAMACGISCVVTNVGDSAGIVGNHGVVVPPRDSVALAKAMHRALSRSAVDREAVRNNIASRFSIERLVSATDSVLLSLIPHEGTGHAPTQPVPGVCAQESASSGGRFTESQPVSALTSVGKESA